MAETTNFFEDGVDRVQEAFRTIGDDFERAQKDFEKRRKRFERDTQKRIQKFRKELGKNDYVKRAEVLRDDVRKQVEGGFDNLLDTFQIASQAEVRKLDRKLNQISKKLEALEKASNKVLAKASDIEAA
jgi:hypothetical protein